jgi:hypothetical protein
MGLSSRRSLLLKKSQRDIRAYLESAKYVLAPRGFLNLPQTWRLSGAFRSIQSQHVLLSKSMLIVSNGFSSHTCLISVGWDLVIDQVAIDIVLKDKSIRIKPGRVNEPLRGFQLQEHTNNRRSGFP